MCAAYEALLPLAARNAVISARFFAFGPVAYLLGCLAVGLEQPEKAVVHFRDALALCQRASFVEFEARIRRELATLGRSASQPSAKYQLKAPPCLDREGAFWTLRHDRDEVRLKDSKGIQYLAALLREPGREFHVGDLVSLSSDTTTADEATLNGAGLHIGGLGDAGEWLDARARNAYRERLAALADALQDAEARGDRDGVLRIRHEREALADELARAVGLGGRSRKAGSASERARVNVQRRIKDVLTSVSEMDPALGRYLELHVKTGVFCSWSREC